VGSLGPDGRLKFLSAFASFTAQAENGGTISSLVNTWSNHDATAMSNFLSNMNMTQATANATKLSSLDAAQALQVVAGFAWQEGFKPPGC